VLLDLDSFACMHSMESIYITMVFYKYLHLILQTLHFTKIGCLLPYILVYKSSFWETMLR